MPEPFYRRFKFELPTEKTQERFINRIANILRNVVRNIEYSGDFRSGERRIEHILEAFMHLLGEQYSPPGSNSYYSHETFMRFWDKSVGGKFLRCLELIENLRKVLGMARYSGVKELDAGVHSALGMSEVDLGVDYKDGTFTPKGAALLDEALVSDPLRWLTDPKYGSVLTPFKKGLTALLESQTKEEGRGDVIRDMYEALEALAKVVTGHDRDLSGKFISMLQLSPGYTKLLGQYIDFGCDFRHAVSAGEVRKWPSVRETEGFVYLTGSFIRLAILPSKREEKKLTS
ncbi:MAG: hypothetical protein HYY45_11685 [Deltaproteobacteria bacterium]|nr:hypothetical protein [Deltaproteobacteria bacterium]